MYFATRKFSKLYSLKLLCKQRESENLKRHLFTMYYVHGEGGDIGLLITQAPKV